MEGIYLIAIIVVLYIARIFAIDFLNFQFELFDFTFHYLKAMLNGERPPKYKRIGWFVAMIENLTQREKDLLNQYCPYYRDLRPELQTRFEKRLIRFKYEKDFYYTKDSVKNKELMIMLLSAFAVQVTFGFPHFRLKYFRSIHIHQHSFGLEGYDWLTLSGFTSGSSGYIAFSETAFLKSIEYPDDGFNVAIHEFAHAVDLCEKLKEDYLDDRILEKWQEHANAEWEKMQTSNTTMLPDYAQKDVDEFYACAVERFFEQPRQMLTSMKDTYYLLSALLRQDPLNRSQPVNIDV